MMRLDKFLCDCQAGTRSEVKKIVKAGRVSVNGTAAKAPDLIINGFSMKNIYTISFISRLAVSLPIRTTSIRQSWTICQRSVRRTVPL